MSGVRIGAGARALKTSLVRGLRAAKCWRLYRKYRNFTLAPFGVFFRNMVVVDRVRHVQGCVVECGVWRGGMSAGMAEILGPDRSYFLFDSFEGLPPASDLDGEAARRWQADTSSEAYYDNCRAEVAFAETAMRLSGVPNYSLVKGWFEDTLPGFAPPCRIAVLRLDGDWYESTLTALESLYPHLAQDGIVIVDDYYAWDGCSRAIHDFLSRHRLTARLTQRLGICVIEPRGEPVAFSPAGGPRAADRRDPGEPR